MGGIGNNQFVVDMMLDGDLVGVPFGRGIGNFHARAREGGWRPNVQERPATAAGNPQARIFAVPMAIWIGIAGMIVGGAAMMSAARQWFRELEVPPSEVVKQKVGQTMAATSAGASAWKKHNAMQKANA